MMRRVYPHLLAAALAVLLLSGCGSRAQSGGTVDVTAAAPASPAVISQAGESAAATIAQPSSPAALPNPSPSASGQPVSDPDQQLKKAAKDIVDALRERDLKRLAEAIDPDKGVTFAPYPYVDAKSAQQFKPSALPSFKDANKLTWGSYDGKGHPIELTFRDYFDKFVYDQDFATAPDVSINKLVGIGNVKFNGQDVYPDASFVEFHFPGFDKKNNGMDWESLILILRPAGSEWKLCAIVHGQWTI